MSLLPIATPFPREEIEISSTQDHHLVVCPPHQHHRRQTQLRDTNHSWLYSCRPAGGGSWFYTMGCFVLLILVNYLIFFLLDFLLFIPSFLVVLVQEKKNTGVDPSCRLSRHRSSTEACIQNSTPSFLGLGYWVPLPRQNNPLPPPVVHPSSLLPFPSSLTQSVPQSATFRNNSLIGSYFWPRRLTRSPLAAILTLLCSLNITIRALPIPRG